MSVYGFRFYFTPLEGVLFAFPSRYLFAIGSYGVFSLGSWSTRIPAGFLVPRRTQAPHHGVRSISCTWLSHTPAGLPRPFHYEPVFSKLHGSSPCGPTTPLKVVWAPPLSLAATHGISGGSLPFLISSPMLLRWFTSHGVAPPAYFIQLPRYRNRSLWVTPFGHPRITGYLLLPVAFRSLSRPSSPRSSQASAINLHSLDHIVLSMRRASQHPAPVSDGRSARRLHFPSPAARISIWQPLFPFPTPCQRPRGHPGRLWD